MWKITWQFKSLRKGYERNSGKHKNVKKLTKKSKIYLKKKKNAKF